MRERKRLVKAALAAARRSVLAVCLVCALAIFSQPAQAQNTYIITDGDRVETYTTSETDPEQVLTQAGFRLGHGDIYDTFLGDGVFQITVKRSQTITVDHEGWITQITSYGETVAQILARLEIPVRPNTQLSHSLDTVTWDGMVLSVMDTQSATEIYADALPFETEYRYDPSLPEGTQQILTPGREGQARYTAHVVYYEGREISRTILSYTVLVQPVTQVVLVGAGDNLG